MIHFEKVTHANIWEICTLEVNDCQKDFVAENVQSLAEAYVTKENGAIALPFGIYNDETLIGFIMIGRGKTGDKYDPDIAVDNYCLWRLMIDKKYQHQGFGKQSILKALSMMKNDEFGVGKSKYCWLSYEKENEEGKKLYFSLGFEETNIKCGNEIVAIYRF